MFLALSYIGINIGSESLNKFRLLRQLSGRVGVPDSKLFVLPVYWKIGTDIYTLLYIK